LSEGGFAGSLARLFVLRLRFNGCLSGSVWFIVSPTFEHITRRAKTGNDAETEISGAD
jgi:hypothetical protein